MEDFIRVHATLFQLSRLRSQGPKEITVTKILTSCALDVAPLMEKDHIPESEVRKYGGKDVVETLRRMRKPAK